jgi:hypothetical protein
MSDQMQPQAAEKPSTKDRLLSLIGMGGVKRAGDALSNRASKIDDAVEAQTSGAANRIGVKGVYETYMNSGRQQQGAPEEKEGASTPKPFRF